MQAQASDFVVLLIVLNNIREQSNVVDIVRNSSLLQLHLPPYCADGEVPFATLSSLSIDILRYTENCIDLPPTQASRSIRSFDYGLCP